MTPNQRILAVDDEPEIRNLLRASLEMDRSSVDLAEDGEEAWRLLQSETYDCILLGLKMPRMDGRQVYKLLRELDKSAAERIIFITGDSDSRDTQDFVYSTGNLIMTKPFQLDELRSQIEKLLMETEAAKSE